MSDMRYNCSLLRRHNWFKNTPYGYAPFYKYFFIDTLTHIKNWIKYGQYDYWHSKQWE